MIGVVEISFMNILFINVTQFKKLLSVQKISKIIGYTIALSALSTNIMRIVLNNNTHFKYLLYYTKLFITKSSWLS